MKLFENGTHLKLWSFIGGYILLIYLTLPVMRDIITALYATIGKEYLYFGINLLLILSTLMIILFALRKGLKTLLWIAIPLIATMIVIFTLERPEERIHFIEYGVLGILVLRAMDNPSWRQMSIAFVFVLLVGTVDEGIQWLLPSRVGDIRDIIMNGAGGALGIWVERFLYW